MATWKASAGWKPRILSACIALSATLALPLPAGAADAAQAPTTSPADDPVAMLIRQLGDDDFSAREEASSKLLIIGEPAFAALNIAAAGNNPEVRARAAVLLHRLAYRPVPGPAPDSDGRGLDVQQLHATTEDGKTSVDVTVDGCSIHIEQSPGDIHMTVKGFIDGKPATEEYQARDARALEDAQPQAYALWQRWNDPTRIAAVDVPVGRMRLHQRMGVRHMQARAAEVVAAQAGDDMDALDAQIHREIRKTQLTDDQQKAVLDQLRQVREAQEAIDPSAAEDDREKQAQAYSQACDALREKMAAVNLPDPGAALPPPASARLGIQVAADEEVFGAGLIVAAVGENSRGEKIGLHPGDLIRAVNGRPMRSVSDLRTAVSVIPTLTITITRAGQELQLNEPPPPPPESPHDLID